MPPPVTPSWVSAHMARVKNTELKAASTKRPMTPSPGRALADRFPAISSEWDPAGNGTFTPRDVTYGSGLVVSWICPAGHDPYLRPVFHRTTLSRGCPACGTAKLCSPKKGKTLAEAFPEIAAQWDYEANYPLTPHDVAPRSNKKAFFICPVGHGTTESYISNRTAGNGCPECGQLRGAAATAARALAKGSLAERNPVLASQWNVELNDVTADDVSCGSPARFWWNCSQGHQPFLAPVSQRHRGHGCPVCGNARRAAALLEHHRKSRKEGLRSVA